ncbi:MAG: pseudouridine synthase [Candidatus Shapirobacteria bacterium]|nr:pseudouridine synthase [Candidatus Shapirobacteria bacterium]
MPSIRLNKYLASIGIASRRKIDAFTAEKRILINNRLAVLGDKVNPETDKIQVDKKIILPQPQTLVYYAVNKPIYVLSTTTDDHGRRIITDYVPDTYRVFPVGRLDFESTGLILLTNDGNLALKLTHPRYHLPKVYLISILGKTPQYKINQMNQANAKAELVESKNNQTIIKITLHEGKKRQIRLLCAKLHLHLLSLQRLSIGPIQLADLPSGQYRDLTKEEINNLLKK